MSRVFALFAVSLLAVPAFAATGDEAVGKAIEARRGGDFQGAKTLLQSALVDNPSHARAYHELGVLHAIHGELDPAITAFAKALQLQPSMTATRKNLAEVLRAAGRYKEALPHFTALQNATENRDIALRGIAICQDALGRPEAAIVALDQLAAVHQNDEMARWVKQQRALLVAGRADAGISVGAAEAEADAHFAAKSYQHALHWYALACRKGPTADRCYKLAVAQLATRKYLAAVGSLRKSLKLDPGHMPSLSAWPTAVRKLRSEGEGALDVGLATPDRQPILRAARALLEGDLLLARRIAEAARKGPHDGVVLWLIEAEALLRNGYRLPADKLLRKVLKRKPGHHIANAARAEILYRNRRPLAARMLAKLPKPAAPPLSAPDDVRASYGSPTRDLDAFIHWRRRAFDRHMRMLLDPGVKPPLPFSFTDAVDPESIRAAPLLPEQATNAPTKRRKSRKKRKRRRRR